ncbi:MAG: fibrobacter succinogenes major paralogous domain-containing protein [Bacteroidia bacterium]|nr:fibrobacter succinogenes major paralogous domain-containing protein [Bacteroidia bacterium]
MNKSCPLIITFLLMIVLNLPAQETQEPNEGTKAEKIYTSSKELFADYDNLTSSSLKTITIGTQTWMAENLDVSTFQNGDAIPEAKNRDDWDNAEENEQPVWCYYEFNSKNGKIYGKLYNWIAVEDSRRLAPKGWHIASDAEWTILTSYLGGENSAGGKLKEAGTVHWENNKAAATNSSGFTALPGGRLNNLGEFLNIGIFGNWWTSTNHDDGNAKSLYISDNTNFTSRDYNDKTCGLSVRCVKD